MNDQFQFRKPLVKRGRFYNSDPEYSRESLVDTARMWINALRRTKSLAIPQDWVISQPTLVRADQPTITWVGHATFLIQIHGFNILTDPVFFGITPFFNRLTPPGITIDQLPPIDAILISHNHWDHMHGQSLKALRSRLEENNGVVLIPEGDQRWFLKQGFKKVVPCTWGQQFLLGQHGQLTCTFLPARHWSRRGLFDRNKSLWGSWMISARGQQIYFAGDTAYGNHFSEIARHFPSIDVALLPIGPCEPRHLLQHVHIDAPEAGKAFFDLNARYLVPMHWGTFNFGADDFFTPLNQLHDWWKQQAPSDKNLSVLKIGQRMVVEEKVFAQVMPEHHRDLQSL